MANQWWGCKISAVFSGLANPSIKLVRLFAAVQDMYKKFKVVYFDSYESGASKLFIIVWCSCCYHCNKTLDWLRCLWHYMPLAAFPSRWTGCSVKMCPLSWLQTYRKASFTLVGVSWTKYANSCMAKIEKNVTSSHHVWCQVLLKSGTLERILSTLPRISHFGRGYHYGAGFTPCQRA